MILEYLKLKNFMRWEVFERDFESPSMTLITGDNGAGKSSIGEGVVWTLYGDTVRGSSPVNGRECQGVVRANVGGAQYSIERTRKGKETSLKFSKAESNLTGLTNTETQRRIDAVFGSYERFVSTRIFSSEHVARFAAATDKGRKQIIEQMKGLEQFDRANTLVKNDLRKVEAEVMKLEVVAARAEGQVQAAESRLNSLHPPDALTTPESLEDVRMKLRAQAEETKKLDAVYNNLRAEAQKMDHEVGIASSALSTFQKHFSKTRSISYNCPTCGGAWTKAQMDEHQVGIVKLTAECEILTQTLVSKTRQLAELAEDVSAVKAGLDVSKAALSSLTTHGLRLEEISLAQSRHTRDLEEATAEHLRAHQTYQDALQSTIATKVRVQGLEAVETILGLRGARTMLFGKYLSQIQTSANVVLSTMGSDLRVKVSGKATQASGKEIDAVSVEVTGAGGGIYKGGSRGERSLIDIALLLGLAELQTTPGLMFFDELFDSLDETNIDRVSLYLNSLTSHQVIVVSHAEALKTRFPGSSRIHVRRNGAASFLGTTG